MKQLLKAVCGISLGLLVVVGEGEVRAQDTVVREGLQIGALGAVRTTLPETGPKYGLQFDIKDFGDSTAALRALDQGELEVANTTIQHMVRAITEGMDVVWVVGATGGNNVLVASEKLSLPANDPAALKKLVNERKGSKPISIAVPTGSMQHAKLVTYLRSAGVDPDKDVTIVNVGFPNHPRALEAGEVDMAMTLAPFGALAMEKGSATMVAHLQGGEFGKQEIGFIVQRKLIDENPELVQKIVNAHVDAMNKFIGNKEQQIAYEMKYSRFPEAVVVKTETDFLNYHWRTNVADLKTMAKEMKAMGWAQTDVSDQIEKHIDLSFLSKATGKPVSELMTWD